MSFSIDFNGRLKKVKATVSTSLNALFEAIANAFDATSELGQSGRIVVKINRKAISGPLLTDEETPQVEITSFQIIDNGEGFTNENLHHFTHSDTTHKASGKGVGRLLWLHVFEHAKIESVFKDGDSFYERSFAFSKQFSGVREAETTPKLTTRIKDKGTSVTLSHPFKERQKYLSFSARQLGEKLLEHFLLYFTAIGGQSLNVVETLTGETVRVVDLYNELIGDRHKEESFSIRGYEFSLHHLFVKPTVVRSNSVFLCANNRVVTNEAIGTFVSEVGNAVPVTVPTQGSL